MKYTLIKSIIREYSNIKNEKMSLFEFLFPPNQWFPMLTAISFQYQLLFYSISYHNENCCSDEKKVFLSNNLFFWNRSFG